MSRVLAKNPAFGAKGYNVEIDWFDGNFFSLLAKEKIPFSRTAFWENEVFTLLQSVPSIQTPQSLMNVEVSKEKSQTSTSTEKKDTIKAVWEQLNGKSQYIHWQACIWSRLGLTQHYLLPIGEDRNCLSAVPWWATGNAVGNQDRLLGSELTEYLVC